MGLLGFLKKVGRAVGAPFRAVGNAVVKGGQKLVGDLARAGQEGGFGGIVRKIGSGILSGAQKIADLPIIQDTPIGRLAQGIKASEALGKAAQSGDIGEALKAGKDIAGMVGEIRGKGGRGKLGRQM